MSTNSESNPMPGTGHTGRHSFFFFRRCFKFCLLYLFVARENTAFLTPTPTNVFQVLIELQAWLWTLFREEFEPLISQQEASQPPSQRTVVVVCAANVCARQGFLSRSPMAPRDCHFFIPLQDIVD